MSKDLEKLELRIQALEQNMKRVIETYDQNFAQFNDVVQFVLARFEQFDEIQAALDEEADENESRIITP